MPTILIVDDNDDIRELLTLQLEKRGCTVVVARNGTEGVLAAANVCPSVILMDVNMPDLDGFEATAQIRGNVSLSRTSVILLTAYALPGDCARALAAGCDDFHSKPIHFPTLFDQIDRLIAEKNFTQHPFGD